MDAMTKKALDQIDELLQSSAALNNSYKERLLEEKGKILTHYPPAPFTISHSWLVASGQQICLEDKLLCNPFDFIGFYSFTLRNQNADIEEFNKCFDLLKKFMHEFIDMGCPPFVSPISK